MNHFQNIYIQLLQSYPKLLTACSVIGALMVLSRVLKAIAFIYKNFIRRRRDLLKRYGENSWVFITGSSDGIGRAFAHAFARRGFNIIICSRTESKLLKVQEECLALNPKIQVKYLKVNFSQAYRPQFFDELSDMLKIYDISVLVNNVGVDVLSPYHELTEQEIVNLITVNCLPVSVLNHRFIPKLLSRDKKSAIINVASLAGEIPMALHNVYSASKAFADFLSRSLNHEYPELDIISLRPSEVSTPMTYHKKKDLLTIDPEDCAEGLLSDMSYEQTSNGPVRHKLQAVFYHLVPEWIFNYVFRNFVGPDFIQERKLAKERANKRE